MQPSSPPDARLARRLRALRHQHWSDIRVTQQQIAEALGGTTPLSLSLISSWESTRRPTLPPASRLIGYATFFATRRSIDSHRARLLAENDLTEDERMARDALHTELLALRFPDGPHLVDDPRPHSGRPLALYGTGEESIRSGTWLFPDQGRIVIVCGSLPTRIREQMPFLNPQDPDYVRSYSLADLDALIELQGHVRAVNPAAEVRILRPTELDENDFTSHLVLLGGVDWNPINRDITRRLQLPVRQKKRLGDEDPGCFSTSEGATFEPVLDAESGTLLEDVAHFFRGTNPYNGRRTVTLCNGMYGRGTYGAVRALTDPTFRHRNEDYVRERFGRASAFSILMRVRVIPNGTVATPDWTKSEDRLHEWPIDGGET